MTDIIEIPLNTKCDVLIIGGGIAGALLAKNLLIENSNLHVILVEKRKLGSRKPSYYMPLDMINKLGAKNIITNIIDKFTYEIDSEEYQYIVDTKAGFASIDYQRLIAYLVDSIEIIYDEFIGFADRSKKIASFKSHSILAKVIVDASGWESPVRTRLRETIPKIGARTVVFELDNCRIDDPHLMRLCVGDYASLGFWIEPQGDDRVIVGSGYWTNLDERGISNDELDDLVWGYISKYEKMFQDAILVRKNYGAIAVDPVSRILINNNIVSFGESAGMTNPYWLLGSGIFYNLSKSFSTSINNYITGNSEDLLPVQKEWQELRSKYAKLWSAARVVWNGKSEDWKNIFERREKLKKFTQAEDVIKRQSGSSYGIRYSLSLLGLRRISKITYYIFIFYSRMWSDYFFRRYNFQFREISKMNRVTRTQREHVKNEILMRTNDKSVQENLLRQFARKNKDPQ